jgi:hypothetical protein
VGSGQWTVGSLRGIGEAMGIHVSTKPVAKKPAAKRFSVYVIGLNKLVLKERKFLAANPQYNPAKPCVYVGMTGLSPRQRFLNHRLGIKGCKYVKKYGMYLRPRLYEQFNPMTYTDACEMERELARD